MTGMAVDTGTSWTIENLTEQCGLRMEDRMKESESGQDELKRQKERADHWFAGYVEEGTLSAVPVDRKQISEMPRTSQPREAVLI